MYLEITWHGDQRHLGRLQAEGTATPLAVEMGMHVVDGSVILSAMTVGSTHRIFEHASAVVDGMYQVMGKKQGDGSVDG